MAHCYDINAKFASLVGIIIITHPVTPTHPAVRHGHPSQEGITAYPPHRWGDENLSHVGGNRGETDFNTLSMEGIL